MHGSEGAPAQQCAGATRLIIGAGLRSAIATLVERKTRLTLLVPLRDGHTAPQVGDALIATFTKLPPSLRRTLTWDQGNEMFHHERIERATGLQIYFADQHSPWQRGTNENTNGLLRQYFPKGGDLRIVTDERARDVANRLNQRPRLCLDDRTPEPVNGTMATSPHSQLIRNDQWNLPPGMFQLT